METLHVKCSQEPLIPSPSEQGHYGHVPGVGAVGAPHGLAWQGLCTLHGKRELELDCFCWKETHFP